jgi:hypothetical protein
MASVADELRRIDREALARLSGEERIALALALGDTDVEALQQARGIDRETAVRVIRRQRQAGRQPSACMSALLR